MRYGRWFAVVNLEGALKTSYRAGLSALAAAVLVVIGGCSGSSHPTSGAPVPTARQPSPQSGSQPGLPAKSPSPGATPSHAQSPSPGHPPATYPPPPLPNDTLHFIANVGDRISAVRGLGYTLMDTGSDPELVNALPAGVRALVWMGSLDNSDCGNPGYNFSAFTKAVDRLVGNPKVFGYFLADEPHPKVCPTTAADLRQRADYIHAHDPTHYSFVVVLDGSNQCNGSYGCEFAALGPAKTHVDLIGLDPYPCNTSNAKTGCEYSKIKSTVQNAKKNGIPASAIVPVFQAFGQSCAASNYYRMPTAAEMTKMLSTWHSLAPKPAFDYTYTWGRQGSACPTLVDANGAGGYPDLQAVMLKHNTS